MFARYTGDGFDPISPAAIAADVTIGFALRAGRGRRVSSRSTPWIPTPAGTRRGHRTAAQSHVRRATAANPYEQEIRRAEARALVERLMWLAGGAPMPQVRAVAYRRAGADAEATGFDRRRDSDKAAQALMAADIKRFLERPAAPIKAPETFTAPPGAPIGGDSGNDWLASRSGTAGRRQSAEWCGEPVTSESANRRAGRRRRLRRPVPRLRRPLDGQVERPDPHQHEHRERQPARTIDDLEAGPAPPP